MSKQTYREAQRIKPLGKSGIEKCRGIAKNGYAKVNEVMVDSFSASAIVAVYDAIGPENQAKLEGRPVAQACDLCFQIINKVQNQKGAS